MSDSLRFSCSSRGTLLIDYCFHVLYEALDISNNGRATKYWQYQCTILHMHQSVLMRVKLKVLYAGREKLPQNGRTYTQRILEL